MLNTTDYKLFVVSQLAGVGARTIRNLSINVAIDDVELGDISSLDRRVEKAIDRPGSLAAAQSAADHLINQAQAQDVLIVGPSSTSYPFRLMGLKDSPGFIYCQGDVGIVNDLPAVAVIGTRKPTAHGEKTTESITRYFAERGWLIVSGLALGCDSIAHRTALETNGKTAAVLAHGLHTIAPPSNTELAWKIVDEGGLLISEYPLGVEPTRYQYVERDRIQAGLSLGVVLVQSSRDGGSLHAAAKIIKYGRILAVPHATPYDQESNAEGVMANIVLTGTGSTYKGELLNLPDPDEMLDGKLFVLTSNDDYPDLEKSLVEGYVNS